MKPLDDELRSLFKRKEPPDSFTERVLARLDTEPPRRTFAQRLFALYRRPVLRWAVVAAIVCIMAAAGVAYYQQQQREQRVRNQAVQAVQALEIARAELNTALEQAQSITVEAISTSRITRTQKE